MNEYTYLFEEKSYGRITIRSDSEPSRDEVIKGIENGDGYFGNIEYHNIRLDKEDAA